MTYLIALLCPPLALPWSAARCGPSWRRCSWPSPPLTWNTGPGLLLAALTILWACRVVGDSRAKRELDGFLEVFHEAKVQHR